MKLKRIILVLSLFAISAVLISGAIYYSTRLYSEEEKAHAEAEESAFDIATHIDQKIAEHQTVAKSIAGLREIKKSISGKDKKLIQAANEHLKHFQMSLNAEAIYLMDSQGVVRASSNHDSTGSFVGKNYSFRPYFKEAIQGRLGVYPALGVTSNTRGVYISCPVFSDEDGVAKGVLVMKESLEHISEMFDNDDMGMYLLTSPEGIVFISSYGKMDRQSLWKLSEAETEMIREGRQFGNGPWTWSGFDYESPFRAVAKENGAKKVAHEGKSINMNPTANKVDHVMANGKKYMSHFYVMNSLPGWKVHYFHDMAHVYQSVKKPLFKKFLILVLPVLLLFLCFSGFLYRLASREIDRREKAESELQNVFKAVEKAKKEWEGSLDCIDDKIVIVDSTGIIKRMNQPFQQFANAPFLELIGRDWRDVFNKHSFMPEAELVPGDPQKIWHEDTQSWLVITKFNLEIDQKLDSGGFIVTISDETELYSAIMALDEQNYKIETNRSKLEKALEEVSTIITKVSNEKDFSIRSTIPDFLLCYEMKDCNKIDCPCHNNKAQYCWMTPDTLCESCDNTFDENGIKTSCLDCEVYKTVTSDPINRIGEEFNHMMAILEDKNKEVQVAYEELDKQNIEIENNRAKLQEALNKLTSIIERVANEEDFGVRFDNPDIQKCWTVMKCGKQGCPCFGEDPMRCWQIAGTYCGGEVQGEFAKKRESCITCKNFNLATQDPIYKIGEEFNNMMHILESKNNELQGAYEDLKSAQSQILQQEKMASVGQLAAGVAHEINNPMGFIGSNLASLGKYSEKLVEFIGAQGEILEKLNDPEILDGVKAARKKFKLDFIIEDIQDLITESLDGADRVKKIVMGLKNFSRVDQAEQQMADMNECVDSTLNVVNNEIKYKCTVEKEYGDVPQIMCFPQQLNQVFMNLIVNGAQAIEEQGVLTIKTYEQDGFVNVSITDTGSGISPEHQSRIFEPFFTTKDVGKGTGLGMSIAWDIIQKHGGDIELESELGKGTTFTVKLPIENESGPSEKV